jgi:selenocysteine-specific elongation factor
MPIIGTAGHVDHGKSTLVQALTGRDPDRWAEEKARGLTIDLGFAWADIGGTEFGFVDVPGHERFIKNMLAGVVSVDCALLVVAADSGWMPQTEEHVRVLDLLNASTGVIVLTRTDLVDADTVELATLEIIEEVAGTSLADWKVVPVSALTGAGLDDLRSVLGDIGSRIDPNTTGPFRMWVDRTFTIHGAGVVVTGTVQRGTLAVDDDVQIEPGNVTARVRGLHRHEEATGVVQAGQRAAISLTGVGINDIERGSLLSSQGTSLSTRRLIIETRAARGFDDIPARGAFHLHTGTADRPATVRRVTDTAMVVILDKAVPASVGDRVIIRESGRQAVVGGGLVIDTSPQPRVLPDSVQILAAAMTVASNPSQAADALVMSRGCETLEVLASSTGGGRPESATIVGVTAVSEAFAATMTSAAADLVEQYHTDHPRRPGIPNSELASKLGIDRVVLAHLVTEDRHLSGVEGSVQHTSFSHALSDEDEAAWESTKMQLEESFDVPRSGQIPLDQEVLHSVIRRGDLVRINEDLVFTSGQIDEITARVAELRDGFTVSEFKDHFLMARRQSVPLLEWLDKTGVTHRKGDGRVVRNR